MVVASNGDCKSKRLSELKNLSKEHLLKMLDLLQTEVGSDKIEAVRKIVVGTSKKQRKGAHAHSTFQLSNYKARLIALKFSYLGERYCGLARQKMTDETVEAYLEKAMVETNLISSIEACEYSRCGRTDKGVHASG